MLFDQYQRYKNAEKIINSVRKAEEKLNILEVGANEHKNLEKFLPSDKITYLDIELSEERRNDPAYILGDATQMDIESSAYDVVVALDVYEHVLPERRKNFLAEVSRVASRLFIIGAPFDTVGVSESEARVNSVYRCLYGKNHPWLIEHIENGLPKLEQTIEYLDDLGYKINVLSHGNLSLWERLMSIHLASAIDVELIDYAEKIYDVYNKCVFESDYGEYSYRQFIVGTKNGYEADLNPLKYHEQSIELLDELVKQFWILYGNAKQKQGIKLLKPDEDKENITIYFDEGSGFSEERKKRIALDANRVVLKINCDEFEDVQNIRIDPLESSAIVKINDISFWTKSNELVWKYGNDMAIENVIFAFENNYGFRDDAQIIVPAAGVKIDSIAVDYEYYKAPIELINSFYDLIFELNGREKIAIVQNENLQQKIQEMQYHLDAQLEEKNAKIKELEDIQKEFVGTQKELKEINKEFEETKKEFEKTKKELDHYQTHYFAAINQREELKGQLQTVNQAYNRVINSECWRFTKPIRVVLGSVERLCCSNRYSYLVAKGLKSLLTDGVRQTWIKVKLKIKTTKQNAEYCAGISFSEEEQKKQRSTKFDKDILFSIVVPLYNTPQIFLKEMIESVQNQTYGKWELCLADGSDSKHAYVGRLCQQYIKKDSRIKYKKLQVNGGISENTNAAIEMASGNYIGLFDHDDLLHPAVLYEYMNVLSKRDADIIYCDEDKCEKLNGKYFDPNFKPDFSIDYLRSNNYICHFTVFKKALLEKTGLFRKEFDGSQDHDMILRLAEVSDDIVHVPKVLYHWRCSAASVAANPNAKPYTAEAGIHAVNEHLERCGLRGKAESSVIHPNIYRIKYEIIGNPLLSIIIPNKDHKEDLSRCIDSIVKKSTYKNYEIIIIENNSVEQQTFKYYEELEKSPNIQIVTFETQGEFNYSAINNYGVQYARGEHIILLNNDIEIITENWIEEMLMYSQREDVGAVGAKLYYPNDTIQHAGVILGIGGVGNHSHKHFPRSTPGYMGRCCAQQNLSAVTAACMMMRRAVFEEVGGLDEKSFKVAFNDVDLCMRIRQKGYLIVWTPYAEAYHYESISRGLEDTPEKQERFLGEVRAFQERWEKELQQGDPYYNPNLTLEREDFSFK